MPIIDLTDQEAQWLTNMLATHEFPWIYTNPLLNKLAAAQQQKGSPHGGVDQERRPAEHGGGAPDNGAGARPPDAGPNPERSYADGYAERIARERPSRDHYPD